MNRRDFLKVTRTHIAKAAIAGVCASSYAYSKTNKISETGISLMRDKLAAIEDKVESLDKRTKKRLRFLYAVTALSVGMDISMIM